MKRACVALLGLGRLATAWPAQEPGSIADLRPTVSVGTADVQGGAVRFRELDGGILNVRNSRLPVAADEGLWRRARALPAGARLRLHVSQASAPADGHSALHLVLRLEDAAGAAVRSLTRVRLEVSRGRLQAPSGEQGQALEIAVPAGIAELDLLAPVTAGAARVRAASGAVRVEGTVDFVPQLRPLIAIGLIESGVAWQRVSAPAGAAGGANLNFEDSLRHWGTDPASGSFWSAGGRAAAFVKGTIAPETLLTGAFDSNKVNPLRFFADVDPNQYYPISGDAALVDYDARSTSKLYLRLDRGASFALYGDFQTLPADSSAWLGSYARTLTGFLAHYETPRARLQVFAAEAATHQFVDEQPGRGLSGPYAISQTNALANSERIELLVRDRNQPALVLSRRVLTRYADYDFEPFSGRVVFRQPVPSVDENLNPVSIRITYEVDSAGRRYWVGGVAGEVALRENLMLGARYAQDQDPLTAFRLYGTNAVWRPDRSTTLTVDLARSEGFQLEAQTLAGLAPVVPGAALSADPRGSAGRIELTRHDEALDARLYAGRADATFQNANSPLAPGRTEAGLHATYQLTEGYALELDALHSRDAASAAHRSAASADLSLHPWRGAKLETGLSYVNQSYNAALPAVAQYGVGAVPGTALGAPLNNTGFGFLGGGMLASPLGAPLALPMAGAPLTEQDYVAANVKLTQQLSEAASVYGQYAHALGGEGQLAAVGGEYRMSDAERVYARYEDLDSLTGIYGLGAGQRAHQLVAGFDSAYMRDGSVYNEYRLAGTASGQSTVDALGVRNLWRLAPGWSATTTFEHQQLSGASALPAAPPVGGSNPTASAVALGLEYLGSPLWKAAGRLERRVSDFEREWLSTLAVVRKLSDDWSLLARNIYLASDTQLPAQAGGRTRQDRLQLGMAYRDTGTNLWNALLRYEYRTDTNSALVTGTDTRSHILALSANYHPRRAWELQGQLAGKSERDLLGAVHSDFSALLLSARAVWDVSPRWDVGLLGSTTGGGGTRDQGLALELGYRVIDNLWLSGGAIAGRYADTELFSADSSWRGVYLRVRFKFDERLLRGHDPAVNRTLDAAAEVPRQ